MSFYQTRKMIQEFVKNNECIDENAELITYRLYVDEDGELHDFHDGKQEGYEEILEVVELNEDQRANLDGLPYQFEFCFEYEELFDELLDRLTNAYVDKCGYWKECIEE